MEKVHINKPLLTIVGKTLAVFASLIFLVWVVQFYVLEEHTNPSIIEDSLESGFIHREQIITINFCGKAYTAPLIMISDVNILERIAEIATTEKSFVCEKVMEIAGNANDLQIVEDHDHILPNDTQTKYAFSILPETRNIYGVYFSMDVQKNSIAYVFGPNDGGELGFLIPFSERITVNEGKEYTLNFCGTDLVFRNEVLVDEVNLVKRLAEIALENKESYICKDMQNQKMPEDNIFNVSINRSFYFFQHTPLSEQEDYLLDVGYMDIFFDLNKNLFYSIGFDGRIIFGSLKKQTP